MKSTDTKTDGGTDIDHDLFDSGSDVELARSEQLSNAFTEYVYAPVMILWDDWRARIGSLIILGYLLMGTIGVILVEPATLHEGPRLEGVFEGTEFLLGTDILGRDLFAMIVHATPAMLQMIIAGGVFTTVVATIIGTVSGYKGGVLDRVLMTVSDIALTIPGLPLVIVIVVIFPPQHPVTVGILLSINAWAGLARALRSEVLAVREESYVEASRTMNVPTRVILTKDIIPNLMPYIMVNFVGAARGVIFGSVGLYFLGILPFTTLNWGVILNMAYTQGGSLYTLETIHWFLAPMITIILLSYGLILFAQGMDRVFNPRIRARHVQDDAGTEDTEDDGQIQTTVTEQI
ncbi:ABC transporter permease subunit [Halomontanus rarus]|uniref:ABC transporter permease subunit n=1 Tax=Halomontanus rarus TaxID=3034020 RepID=UPI001A980CBC